MALDGSACGGRYPRRLAGCGLVTLMSGMPESALEAANQANVDSGSRRPDRVCNGNLGSARTLQRWFDTSCYVLQPLYQ